EQKIRWKYALKNALYPLITLIANMLPALIAGSVVIEQIFAIPGMGKLTIDAIFQRDWPVVYAVLMIGAFLTVLGILLADILYSLFDPRVKLK
ncbi:MAG: ABC transporter permease, partial [Bacteroidota bacterium]